MKNWFQVKLQADDPTVAEIYIIDVIGDWIDQMINEMWQVESPVTAKAFVDSLSQLPAAVTTIRVHVNSPGGDVFAALNIANALRDQSASKGRTVQMFVDGLAASAASVVIMAGDEITIADNALVMVHNPWSVAVGSAADMRKAAAVLDTVRGTIIASYGWKSKLTPEQLGTLMDAETWMDADEAIANGFADSKVSGVRVAASISPRAASKLSIPEKYKARVAALLRAEEAPVEEPPPAPEPEALPADPAPELPPPAVDPVPAPTDALPPAPSVPPPAPPAAATAEQVITACAAAALDIAFARDLITQGLSVEAMNARIEGEKQARAKAAAREREIRATCARVKQSDLADGYVAGGMTPAQVRDHLTKITAKLDKAEIDAHLGPEQGTRQPVIDVNAVYAERNKLLRSK